MPTRFLLALGLGVLTLITGVMYFLSDPDQDHPEYWYDASLWSSDYHNAIVAECAGYGIRKEWISSVDPPGKRLDRPVWQIRVPTGFPVSDLSLGIQTIIRDESPLLVDGFDSRRENTVSLHIHDKGSVVATYQIKTDSKLKRQSADVYLLTMLPAGDEPPALLTDKSVLSTPVIVPSSVKKTQETATRLSGLAIDFGLYLNGQQVPFRLSNAPGKKEFSQVDQKLSVLFPSASVFLTPGSTLKLPAKTTRTYHSGQLFDHPEPLKTTKDLEFVLGKYKDSPYLIFKASPDLFEQDELPDLLTVLNKKGYRFRYFRDFKTTDYDKADFRKSGAGGSKPR